ncbi:MAG TPA: hypothetical protein VGG21_02140, partial [Acidimicrobiales bacterium]
QFDVQLFAATHSGECVVAARNALTNSDELRLFRLDREDGGGVRIFAFDSDQIDTAIDLNVDVR